MCVCVGGGGGGAIVGHFTLKTVLRGGATPKYTRTKHCDHLPCYVNSRSYQRGELLQVEGFTLKTVPLVDATSLV